MTLADHIGRYWAGAEVIYGVIIAMTFTSVLRGNPAVLEQFLGKTILSALFCCISWGIADGLFYSWERGYIIRQENTILQFSQLANEHESAVSYIREQLDDTILRNIPDEPRLKLYEKLVDYLSGIDTRGKLSINEAFSIMLGTCIRSAGAGLIIVIPFFVIPDVQLALRISNLAGIILLFGVGYSRARGRSLLPRIASGFGTSLIGIIIAGITIVLGG